uniref:Uncharacterized protein n=1 Tax=Globodera rostochiensis TaxID=31243 RepID=A0A914IBB3_GLORO
MERGQRAISDLLEREKKKPGVRLIKTWAATAVAAAGPDQTLISDQINPCPTKMTPPGKGKISENESMVMEIFFYFRFVEHNGVPCRPSPLDIRFFPFCLRRFAIQHPLLSHILCPRGRRGCCCCCCCITVPCGDIKLHSRTPVAVGGLRNEIADGNIDKKMFSARLSKLAQGSVCDANSHASRRAQTVVVGTRARVTQISLPEAFLRRRRRKQQYKEMARSREGIGKLTKCHCVARGKERMDGLGMMEQVVVMNNVKPRTDG